MDRPKPSLPPLRFLAQFHDTPRDLEFQRELRGPDLAYGETRTQRRPGDLSMYSLATSSSHHARSQMSAHSPGSLRGHRRSPSGSQLATLNTLTDNSRGPWHSEVSSDLQQTPGRSTSTANPSRPLSNHDLRHHGPFNDPHGHSSSTYENRRFVDMGPGNPRGRASSSLHSRGSTPEGTWKPLEAQPRQSAHIHRSDHQHLISRSGILPELRNPPDSVEQTRSLWNHSRIPAESLVPTRHPSSQTRCSTGLPHSQPSSLTRRNSATNTATSSRSWPASDSRGSSKATLELQAGKSAVQPIDTELGPRYFCDVSGCGKSFTRNFNLTQHKSAIHNEERRFECSYCIATFYRRNDLSRHERAHTGERPYRCECGLTFTRTDLLTRHKQGGTCTYQTGC